MNVVTASTLAQTCLTAGMSEDETAQLLYDHGYRPPEPIVNRAQLSRRSFITRMGAAVAAASILPDDPLKLLWSPEAKTIVDVGAHRTVLAATTEQLFDFRNKEFERSISNISAEEHRTLVRQRRAAQRLVGEQRVEAIVNGEFGRLTYRGGKIVGNPTEQDLRVVNHPMTPTDSMRRNRPNLGYPYQSRVEGSAFIIDTDEMNHKTNVTPRIEITDTDKEK